MGRGRKGAPQTVGRNANRGRTGARSRLAAPEHQRNTSSLRPHTQRNLHRFLQPKSDCIYHAPIDLEQQTVAVPNPLVHGKYNLNSV